MADIETVKATAAKLRAEIETLTAQIERGPSIRADIRAGVYEGALTLEEHAAFDRMDRARLEAASAKLDDLLLGPSGCDLFA